MTEAATAEPSGTPAVSERSDVEVFDSTQHHEEIAQVAYALWQERGCAEGSPDEDWRRAEEQVRRKYASADS